MSSSWNSVVVFVTVAIIILLGSRVPLPGVNTTALDEQMAYSSNGEMMRFSVVALGVMPLFTVFAYAEIAKLVFPSFALWQRASSENTFLTSMIIRSIILALAAIQGYGIVSALAAMGLLNGSPGLVVTGVASFVGTSALMIWLAGMARIPHLGNGFWLLLAVSLICAFPGELIGALEMTRFGAVSSLDWLVAVLIIVFAVSMIVVANVLLSGNGDEARPTLSMAVLLWPPFLANIVAGYLFVIPSLFIPELFSDAPQLLNVVSLVLSAVLIPFFVYAYYRLISIVRPDVARSDIRSILLVVAGIQILVCVGLGFLKQATSFSFIPGGGMLIVCVTVLLALRWSPGRRPALGI